MTRFSPYPRRAYARLFHSWARRNMKTVAIFVVGVAGLLAFETAVVLVLIPDSSLRWWLLGALQVAIVALGLHLINAAFLAHEREAIWQLRGAWGEEATRDELRRAKKKKLVWGWIDSIDLQAGDLDHLVLPRQGGFVVIDSKWRSEGNDAAEMAASAGRARLRAEAVARSLLKSERASHRARMNALTVRPLVVIWGPAQHHVPTAFCMDDVDFVGGRGLVAWLESLAGDPVDKVAARNALAQLREFRSGAWEAKKRRAPSR